MFAAAGFHAVGVQAVADAVGSSKMTLYANYGDKDGLVAAVLDDARQRWAEVLRAAAETADDAQVHPAAVCAQLANDPPSSPLVIVALGVLELPKEKWPRAAEMTSSVVAEVTESLRRLAGPHAAPAPEVAAERALSPLLGVSLVAARQDASGGSAMLRRAAPALSVLLSGEQGTASR